jgi:hypothetical protein
MLLGIRYTSGKGQGKGKRYCLDLYYASTLWFAYLSNLVVKMINNANQELRYVEKSHINR